jgi:alkylhydroperoxidase/carboxymuconolactone decarboxylase family protein YurZ
MRTLLASAGLALLLALATEPNASAQEPPEYFKQTLPDQASKPHWDLQLAVTNPKGALDGKTKQLIALGVVAQIPCERRPLQPPRSSVSTAQCCKARVMTNRNSNRKLISCPHQNSGRCRD